MEAAGVGEALGATATGANFESWRLLEKDPAPEGSVEDPSVAFHLFRGVKPRPFGTYGFLSTPHLGCYSEDYNPFLPIMALSAKLAFPPESAVIDPSNPTNKNIPLPESIIRLLSDCIKFRILENSSEHPIENQVDIFAIIHAGFTGQTCHHFHCNRTDEFNIMYHPWLFARDAEYVSSGGDISAYGFLAGVFEGEGIEECHNFEGGMSLNDVIRQPVVAHGTRFSPNVMNLRLKRLNDYLEKVAQERRRNKIAKEQLEATAAGGAAAAAGGAGGEAGGGGEGASSVSGATTVSGDTTVSPPLSQDIPSNPDVPKSSSPSSPASPPSSPYSIMSDPSSFATFYSFAVDKEEQRVVIVLHCLPLGDDSADKVRELLKGETKLGVVMDKLQTMLPTFTKGVRNLMSCDLG